jgi:hypothetical protein
MVMKSCLAAMWIWFDSLNTFLRIQQIKLNSRHVVDFLLQNLIKDALTVMRQTLGRGHWA